MDDGDSDDHDQKVIIIPIKDKSRDPSPAATAVGYRTENGVTVINIDKSNNANGNVVCEICSSTLKSMKYLERHMKSVHRDIHNNNNNTGCYEVTTFYYLPMTETRCP